jgi:hypothetical protein
VSATRGEIDVSHSGDLAMLGDLDWECRNTGHPVEQAASEFGMQMLDDEDRGIYSA